MEIYKNNLFVEMYTQYEGHLHGFKKILATLQTTYQKIEIIDTYEYGICLILDGMMQSSQLDEYVYHEFLVHPAMISHPNPEEVLIIGGGEGATLREVLKHPIVKTAEMVEIDDEVISFSKEHLTQWHQGSFDDARTKLIIDDGRHYLEKNNQKYDVIIIDISDPGSEGPAYLLYTKQFYSMLNQHLKPNGVIALQAGTSSVVQGKIMSSIYKTLQLVFPIVRPFEASIPSFDLPWGFCIASNQLDPKVVSGNEVDMCLKNRQLGDLKAYDGETHEGLFSISKSLRTTLKTQGRVIVDEQPVYTPLSS